MQLVQTKGDSRFPGAYVVSEDYYKEMVDGKENGQYKITHSGNWVYVEYRRELTERFLNSPLITMPTLMAKNLVFK